MKKVEIKSGEFRFVGKLVDRGSARKTCRVFENMLPLKSQFIHVRWSGEGVWIPYGRSADGSGLRKPYVSSCQRERCSCTSRRHQRDGNHHVLPARMSASQHGQLSGNHFLTIIEGLDDLYDFGRKVLYDGLHRILKSLCWKTKGLKYGGRDYENRSDQTAGGRGKAFP